MRQPILEHLEPRVLLDAAMPWEPGPPPGARSATAIGKKGVDVEIAENIPAEPGARVTVPVLIDAHGNRVYAASIEVRYDSDRLTLRPGGVREGTVWAGLDGWEFISTVRPDLGWARMIWYTSEPAVTRVGTLAYLDFTVTGVAGEEIVLDVEPFLPHEGGLSWRGHDGSIVVLPPAAMPTPGDANLDGRVDVLDLGRLATSYGGRAGWSGGDFNFDGTVDFMDLGVLASRYGVVFPKS